MFTFIFLFCIWVFCSHIFLCVTCMPDALGEPEENIKSAKTRVPGSSRSQPPCECWESNPDPLEEATTLHRNHPSIPWRHTHTYTPTHTHRPLSGLHPPFWIFIPASDLSRILLLPYISQDAVLFLSFHRLPFLSFRASLSLCRGTQTSTSH